MSQWAPAMWSAMYAVAFLFPENPTAEERLAYNQWFTLIKDVLPCRNCQAHFAEILADKPVDTRSMSALTRWLVEAHNTVNRSLGKPTFTYEEAVQRNLPPAMRHAEPVVDISQPSDADLLSSTTQNALPPAAEVCTDGAWSASQIATVVICIFLLLALLVVIILLLIKKDAPVKTQRARKTFLVSPDSDWNVGVSNQR